ncbi:MAG: hypothetical protein L6R42_003124 [Xanthoria sp. 1 TBL-2021]|nr:MAG: hypothetical protein L6R42_003124 [Xanthoria sp. 1 TBL-2021]
MPKAARNFSSSLGQNLIIGALYVAPIGYYLTLPTVTDPLKAEMKKLDIFRVEKLRGELEEHIRNS